MRVFSSRRLLPLWILLGTLAAPESGFAARGDRWEELKLVCGLLRVPDIDAFVELAHSWQNFETETQGNLHVLATETCPAYLANPNAVESVGAGGAPGVVTLPRYIEEQSRTFSRALTSDSHGQAYLKFLSARFKEMYRELLRYRLRFERSACGQLLMERFQFIDGELGKVRSQTVGVRTSCTTLAGKSNSPPPAPAAAIRTYGEGAPGQRLGPASNSGSDITGTEEARAKKRGGQGPY